MFLFWLLCLYLWWWKFLAGFGVGWLGVTTTLVAVTFDKWYSARCTLLIQSAYDCGPDVSASTVFAISGRKTLISRRVRSLSVDTKCGQNRANWSNWRTTSSTERFPCCKLLNSASLHSRTVGLKYFLLNIYTNSVQLRVVRLRVCFATSHQ